MVNYMVQNKIPGIEPMNLYLNLSCASREQSMFASLRPSQVVLALLVLSTEMFVQMPGLSTAASRAGPQQFGLWLFLTTYDHLMLNVEPIN